MDFVPLKKREHWEEREESPQSCMSEGGPASRAGKTKGR